MSDETAQSQDENLSTGGDQPTDPTPEPEPDPGPPPSTEPPLQPTQPIVLQPAMWYSATAACSTKTCTNYNVVQAIPELYSNAGTANVLCGLCSKRCTILTAVLLDPQPPEE